LIRDESEVRKSCELSNEVGDGEKNHKYGQLEGKEFSPFGPWSKA